MPAINPYLTFLGNCEEAFNYYKSVFDGEFAYLGRFSEMPPDANYPMSEEQRNLIMHVSLPISKETILMGSDTGGEWGAKTVVGNNISLSIKADSKDEADKFFSSLSDGGVASMPMSSTFWGDYFGMLTDKFGINWMISFDENAAKKG